MKKKFRMLLMCMAVVFPMLFIPFVAKADHNNLQIYVSTIPKNGSDEGHLMCGSSMKFSLRICKSESTKGDMKIDWKVTKKDGTPMQAVYDVSNDGTDLEIYAPYGYSEKLEISACINGDLALTDTYTLETQENDKMVGKTFFRFDTSEVENRVTCNAFTEKWNANERTYTIVLPSVTLNDKYINFKGWKCSEGGCYAEGELLTLPKKDGYVSMSAWYESLDDSMVGPEVTTGPAIGATEVPQVTTMPGVVSEPTAMPTQEPTETPILTKVPEVTAKPAETKMPVLTNVPEVTSTPVSTMVPTETNVPEVSITPVPTQAPQITVQPTVKPQNTKVNKVSKIAVKKVGSKKIKVTWSKVENAKGYRIVYSTNKNFKGNTTKYTTTTGTKIVLGKLKKNKTYYVKVRAYKIVDGKKIYGAYSSVKKITLK